MRERGWHLKGGGGDIVPSIGKLFRWKRDLAGPLVRMHLATRRIHLRGAS